MSSKQPQNYQELSSELDRILAELSSGQLDIDQAINKYQRGAELIAELRDYLKTSENKITKLKINFDK